jgi:hypothetical protein
MCAVEKCTSLGHDANIRQIQGPNHLKKVACFLRVLFVKGRSAQAEQQLTSRRSADLASIAIAGHARAPTTMRAV